MQYTRRFLSIVGISLVVAVAAGCEDEKSSSSGGGGEGGEAGSWGVGGSTSGNGGSTSSGGTGSDGEPEKMKGMTEAHNIARANVSPAAQTPLPPLTWSPDVANVAQAYAEKCIWGHSMTPGLGENLYATTGGGNPQDVVGSWVSEVADYDYGSNSCSGVCGHYTQVVWAETLRLGCGMAVCTTGSPFGGGTWENWVCNYDPPGNWVGEKPY